LHFVAAIHDTDLFECQATPNEIRDALESAPLRPTDGWLSIPASPGLGVAIDEAALARFSPRHGA
jgi:L-alanine-DL-glutamate epimerase-like enolase superfamily enzyme